MVRESNRDSAFRIHDLFIHHHLFRRRHHLDLDIPGGRLRFVRQHQHAPGFARFVIERRSRILGIRECHAVVPGVEDLEGRPCARNAGRSHGKRAAGNARRTRHTRPTDSPLG